MAKVFGMFAIMPYRMGDQPGDWGTNTPPGFSTFGAVESRHTLAL